MRLGGFLAALVLAGCSPAAPPAPAPPPVVSPAPLLPDPTPEAWETEKDPVKARSLKLEAAWRLNPCFTGMKLRFIDSPPALVCVEEWEDGAWDLEGGQMAAVSLRLLADAVVDLLRESGLPAPPLSGLGDERIRLMLFGDAGSFDRWHARNGMPNPGSSYYLRSDRMLLCRPRSIGIAGRFELGAKGMELGTRALRHVYSRHFCGVDDAARDRDDGTKPEPVDWSDYRLHTAFAWFDSGLARHFADLCIEPSNGNHVVTGPPRKEDLDFIREAAEAGKLWPLEEFLFSDPMQIQARADVRSGGAGSGGGLRYLALIQGSFLFRYLLEGENRRWRPAFLRVVRNEFSGISGTPYLLEAFGLVDGNGRTLRSSDPKVKAWIAEVEAGYLKYAGELAKPR